MDDYIDIKIDIFEHTGQRARVRKSITVTMLIEEILKEFDDIGADTPAKYAVYLRGADHPFTSGDTLEKLDIQPQDELVFDYTRQAIRQMLPPANYATLREETTGKVFDIQWQPSVIGRPSGDMDHNLTLAVNTQLIPNGLTVSRRHAQITFSNGRYYIEALAEYNPVFLNNKEIPIGAPRELKNSDRLSVGRNQIPFTFMARSTPAKESSSRPVPVSQAAAPMRSSTIPAPPVAPQAASQPPVERVNHVSGSDATQIILEESRTPALVIEKASSSEPVGARLELLAYPFVLGRVVPAFSTEGEVSRRHAEINFDPGLKQYTITDLNSTNRVFVDGQMIEPNRPYPIRHGTRIGLGQKVVLRLEI